MRNNVFVVCVVLLVFLSAKTVQVTHAFLRPSPRRVNVIRSEPFPSPITTNRIIGRPNFPRETSLQSTAAGGTEEKINDDTSIPSELEDTATTESAVTNMNFRTTLYDLFQAAIVGILSGLSVALFKLSIEALRGICYQQAVFAKLPSLVALIPAGGGLSVGLLLLLGVFPPGLRGTVKDVDEDAMSVKDFLTQVRSQLSFVRKSVAAIFTLGTGCSLGPEGPCVEIGMSVSRVVMDIKPRQASLKSTIAWNRLLLSCGAAAGVAAGFNAPIAGVFFALEIMQSTFATVQQDADTIDTAPLLSTTATITPILLASVLSALMARTMLGNHLALSLTEYSLKTPLIELPLYLLLGALSGVVAFVFSGLAKTTLTFFDGNWGPDQLRATIKLIPSQAKPFIGGLLCGIVGLIFPQILFFGYETLNALLANNSLPTSLLLSLLIVKMIMTAISAGSGLVGGTFAPSLFLGAMTGATFHNVMCALFKAAAHAGSGIALLQGPVLELADVPAYAMVGAASVLAALFRAPLTASLLLFEITRDYDVILPLMASAGVGSLVGDILETKVEQRQDRRRRDQDSVSWGDLADRTDDDTTF